MSEGIGKRHTTGKFLLFFLMSMITLTCYSQNHNNILSEKWMVYDQPINGYNITIHWQCEEGNDCNGTAIFYFSKDGKTKVLTQPIYLEDGFENGFPSRGNDTIVLNQYYDETRQPYLDWRTPVGFADYNFDGKKELVVCGYPRPYRDNTIDDWLDCENFSFFSDETDGFSQLLIEPFYSLSTETCRLLCKFEEKNKTVQMLSSGGACCFTSTTYFFKNGKPINSMVIRHEELNDEVIHDTTYYSH